MTIGLLAELDIPDSEILTEIHRDLAKTMLAPSKALAIPETETFEERISRQYVERMTALAAALWCCCSPSRGMVFGGGDVYANVYAELASQESSGQVSGSVSFGPTLPPLPSPDDDTLPDPLSVIIGVVVAVIVLTVFILGISFGLG